MEGELVLKSWLGLSLGLKLQLSLGLKRGQNFVGGVR